MNVDELMISIGLDPSEVKTGLKQMQASFDSTFGSLKSKMTAFGTAVSGKFKQISSSIRKQFDSIGSYIGDKIREWGKQFAALAAAYATGALFKTWTSEADALGKLSKMVNANIEDLDAWGQTVARSGGSAEGFYGTIELLSGQLAKVAQTGSSRLAMLIGDKVDVGELGRQKDVFEFLMDMAELSQTMSKQEFFGVARAAGIGDKGLISVLSEGPAKVKDMIHAQKEYGVYTSEDAQIAETFNDAVDNLMQTIVRGSGIIWKMILPAVSAFTETLSKFVTYLRKHETFVKAFFIGLAAVIMYYAVPAFVALAASILANPITWLIAAVAALALVFEDLAVWANGGESAFAGLWEAIFGDPEKALQTWENLKKFIQETWESIKAFCLKIWDEMAQGFEDHFQKLVRVINAIKDAFNALNDSAERGSKLTAGSEAYKTDAPTSYEDYKLEADGDILTRPTNILAGEAGPEAIIPLSRGKRNRALDLLGQIAGNFVSASAAQSLPMGGASTVNNSVDTKVTVGTVNITAADVSGGADQFMSGIESRASAWTALANGGIG